MMVLTECFTTWTARTGHYLIHKVLLDIYIYVRLILLFNGAWCICIVTSYHGLECYSIFFTLFDICLDPSPYMRQQIVPEWQTSSFVLVFSQISLLVIIILKCYFIKTQTQYHDLSTKNPTCVTLISFIWYSILIFDILQPPFSCPAFSDHSLFSTMALRLLAASPMIFSNFF